MDFLDQYLAADQDLLDLESIFQTFDPIIQYDLSLTESQTRVSTPIFQSINQQVLENQVFQQSNQDVLENQVFLENQELNLFFDHVNNVDYDSDLDFINELKTFEHQWNKDQQSNIVNQPRDSDLDYIEQVYEFEKQLSKKKRLENSRNFVNNAFPGIDLKILSLF